MDAKQQELRDRLDELEMQDRGMLAQIQKLDSQRTEQVNSLLALKERHSSACQREALGQKNDRVEIEKEIGAVNARIAGFDSLTAAKRSDRQRLSADLGSVGAELQKLNHDADVQRWKSEIATLFATAKAELLESWRLAWVFRSRLRALDGFSDPAVWKFGHELGQKLANAAVGQHVGDVFTKEELAALTRGETPVATAAAAD